METTQLSKRQFGGSAGQSGMPSLWVFLIIVLGILMALVLGTSLSMHLVQRRQRTLLSRRIAAGEVDLEALGIKRLNVPQTQIDKMPQYVFSAQSEEPAVTQPGKTAKSDIRQSTMFSQATCAICLDDFVNNETNVRRLPCNHIFHPECIDPFLRDNSSLCPLCKKSALPAGFCPIEVTNVMVRRERLTRRVRENRRIQMQSFLQTGLPRSSAANTSASRPGRSSTQQAQVPVGTTSQDTELGPVTQVATEPTTELPAEVVAQGTEARRAWRRERLARQHSQEFDQSGVEARQAEERRPWWRRMMGMA